jgi:demethylmenaquinone methyltransferase/2-methoxy-6-polyprenyl-1,4-benzoquinol methylase
MNAEARMANSSSLSREAPVTEPDRRFVERLFRGLAPRYNGVLLAYSLAQDLRWKQVLLQRLGAESGQRALDLACGTGLLLDRLASRLGPSAVVGADINRAMLRERGSRGTPSPLVQADAMRLPFASRTFDLVTAAYLLKYVHLDRFLGEAARVLRPGGRFGGYDFSRPLRGSWEGQLYSIYLHHVLPGAGGALARLPVESQGLFRFLSEIAETSGWESRIESALRSAGFSETQIVPSLGGAITWVWAQKAPG